MLGDQDGSGGLGMDTLLFCVLLVVLKGDGIACDALHILGFEGSLLNPFSLGRRKEREDLLSLITQSQPVESKRTDEECLTGVNGACQA